MIKSLLIFPGFSVFFIHEFQSDNPVVDRVEGFVNITHRTGTEQFIDPVFAEYASGFEHRP